MTPFASAPRTHDITLKTVASSNGHVAVDLRERVRKLAENRPGVYRMLGPNDEIIYVGKSVGIRNRLLSYFRADRGEKATEIISHTRRLVWEYVPSEFASLLTEMRLIQKHRPIFNVEHKRDRNYCFIKLTRGEAPRLMVTPHVITDGGEYYGPFRGRQMVREVVREISDSLELRDCSSSVKLRFADQMDLFDAEHTPKCIRGDVKKCLAPCAGRCTRSDYHSRVLEARKFLAGDINRPLSILHERMEQAAQRMQFEYAAQLRDRAYKLDEARYELMSARSSIEALTFLYRCSGYDGNDRFFAIKRGMIKAEYSIPRDKEEAEALRVEVKKILAKRDFKTTVTPGEVAEVLLVARWFRIREAELAHVVRPEDL